MKKLGRGRRLACCAFVGSLAALAVLPSQLQAQVTAIEGPVVRGTLQDAATGMPLVAGSVALLRPEGTLALTALTDTDGRYVLEAPSAGAFHLRAERVGYHPREAGPFSLREGETLTVDFELSPAPIAMDSLLITVRRRSRILREGEQLVYGRLLDDESREGIEGATIRLLTESGTAATSLSGEEGLFFLATPAAGTYRLQAERIGYHTSTGPEFHLMLGDTLGVDFYLSVEAVLLEPLVVRATARPLDARYPLTGMDAFLRRYARFSRSGVGEFLTRDSLAKYERWGFPTTAHLMAEKMMSVTFADYQSGRVRLGNRCPSPAYYLDGFPLPDGYPVWGLTPDMLEGVEVYGSPFIPPELNRTGQGARFPCGVVSFWTRREPGGGVDAPVWRKILLGFGIVGLGVIAVVF